MTTSILPNKILTGNATTGAAERTWTYDDGTGDPWLGTVHAQVYTITITSRSHSSQLIQNLASARQFTGLDVKIGDWVTNQNAGRAMQIVEILNMQEGVIEVVLEDTLRYNQFNDEVGGVATLPDGDVVIFEVNEDFVPQVHNIPATVAAGLNPNWAGQITSRFAKLFSNKGIYKRQIAHGLAVGDLLRVATAAEVTPTIVDGTANPATTAAGEEAYINGTKITFSANATTADVVTEINSFNPGNGNVVASDNGGVLRLTAANGEDIYYYDRGAGTSLITGCGLPQPFAPTQNGVAQGQFVQADSDNDFVVAVVTELGPDPDHFFFKWMGETIEVNGSAPGTAGDLVYLDGSGNFTTTIPATSSATFIKLRDTIPAETTGITGATNAATAIALNKTVINPIGNNVADMVTNITGAAIPGVTAADVGGALQITSTDEDLVISDDIAGDVTDAMGIRAYTAAETQSRYLLLSRSGVGTNQYYKSPVVAATTADLANVAYVPGGAVATDNDEGATITNTDGTFPDLVVDGVTIATGDRVLVKDRANAWENGIYTLTQDSNGNTQNFILTRSTDADTARKMTAGFIVAVQQGTTNGDSVFTMTTPDAVIDFTASTIAFAQISGASVANAVTFAPVTNDNIAATDVQAAIAEVAAERTYIHTAGANPTVNNDAADTATIGVVFKTGDLWVNTTDDNAFVCLDSTATAAVWVRVNNDSPAITPTEIVGLAGATIATDNELLDITYNTGSGVTTDTITLTDPGSLPVTVAEAINLINAQISDSLIVADDNGAGALRLRNLTGGQLQVANNGATANDPVGDLFGGPTTGAVTATNGVQLQVTNTSGSPITRGTVVKLDTFTTGGQFNVTPVTAIQDEALGVAAEDIAAASTGNIAINGLVTAQASLSTAAASLGDGVFFDAAGALTLTDNGNRVGTVYEIVAGSPQVYVNIGGNAANSGSSNFKDPATVATTPAAGNIPGYAAGVITVPNANATFFPNGGLPIEIDGVTLANGDRVLVKNQTAQDENGIYVVTNAGVQGLTDAVLERATDADGTGDLSPGSLLVISEGTTNADSGWFVTSDAPITIGTTNITWGQAFGAGAAGTSDLIALGVPTDGDYTTGFGGFTPATSVANAIDTIDEALALLIPPAPPALSTFTLTIGQNARGGDPIRLAASGVADNSAGQGGGIPAAGTQVFRTAVSPAIGTVTGVGDGKQGNLGAVINTVASGSIALTDADDSPATNGSLNLTANADFGTPAGFWRSIEANISNAVAVGYNVYQMTHSVSGNTNNAGFVYDNFTTLPTVDPITAGDVTENTLVQQDSSGVPHYDNTSILDVDATVNNLAGETYLGAGVVQIDMTQPAATVVSLDPGDAGLPATFNRLLGPQNINNEALTIDQTIHTQANVRVRGRNAEGDGAYTNSANLINVMSGNPAAVASGFIKEQDVLVSGLGAGGNAGRVDLGATGTGDTPVAALPGSPNWNSSQDLTAAGYEHEAAVVGGVLGHDQTNYSVGHLPVGPNYATKDAVQYVTFIFQRPAISRFRLQVDGQFQGCWVKLDGIDRTLSANGWLDAFTLYAGAGAPGDDAGAGGNGSNGVGEGAVLNNGGGSQDIVITFGTDSSSSAVNNTIAIRFRLEAGDEITGLHFTNA